MTQSPPSDMSDQEVKAFHGHLGSLWQRIQNLPLAVRQQLGLQEETNTAQDIGDLIAQAYSQIEGAINNLPDDAQMSEKKQALEALKVTVPYHFSFGQKDQVWLNNQINQIVDGVSGNVSQVVSSTVPASATQSAASTSNSGTLPNHEVLAAGAKPATQEA